MSACRVVSFGKYCRFFGFSSACCPAPFTAKLRVRRVALTMTPILILRYISPPPILGLDKDGHSNPSPEPFGSQPVISLSGIRQAFVRGLQTPSGGLSEKSAGAILGPAWQVFPFGAPEVPARL